MKPMTAEPVPAGISPPAPRASASSDPPASPSGALARLASLDAFRGLVILTMTFVNYLAGVKAIPAWAKHLPQDQDGYTFVDVVFPGFLFIVGVAIPLALHKRMARGESSLTRCASASSPSEPSGLQDMGASRPHPGSHGVLSL